MKKNRYVLVTYVCKEDKSWMGRWPFWYALFHHKKVTPCNDWVENANRKGKRNNILGQIVSICYLA